MSTKRKIDHIVYAVPDLDQAILDFQEKTGIEPTFGGYHKNKGTKNALVNIGEGAYLELITVDPENTAIVSPRWMGVDLISEAQVTRWSLKSDQLEHDSKALQAFAEKMGVIEGGQRKTATGDLLSWMMIMPLAAPPVEIAPFVTSWGADSIHPTQNLPQVAPLLDIQFFHPDPDSLMDLWSQLGLSYAIHEDAAPKIKILLDCPKGRVEL
ncbi:MAG: VOC family protein [Saprospiraceae bacterium]|nr:VOC family protein [Saprospiraceae bacterium]